MSKQETTTEDAGLETDQDGSSIVKEIYRGTSADQHDMEVLGVKQVLRRNYRLVPMLGFSSIAVISWEIAPFLMSFALVDGGNVLGFGCRRRGVLLGLCEPGRGCFHVPDCWWPGKS